MRVKICGLRARSDATAAYDAGADYVGLVFFPRSPRHLTLADARWIVGGTPDGMVKVALTVDAEDDALEAILAQVPIDMLQLHGSETPERVAEVRDTYRLPVMKAVSIAGEEDLAQIDAYADVADQILVDARPPSELGRPGGGGTAFDWRLIGDRHWPVPWMLAGGLTARNVAEAVRVTGAYQVDVSSGVEKSPGRKDPALIAAFVRAAEAASVPAAS